VRGKGKILDLSLFPGAESCDRTTREVVDLAGREAIQTRRYTERALAITEKLYGPDDPRTKRLAADLRAIELRGR